MAERVDGLSIPTVPSTAERRAGSVNTRDSRGGVGWGGGGTGLCREVAIMKWRLIRAERVFTNHYKINKSFNTKC